MRKIIPPWLLFTLGMFLHLAVGYIYIHSYGGGMAFKNAHTQRELNFIYDLSSLYYISLGCVSLLWLWKRINTDRVVIKILYIFINGTIGFFLYVIIGLAYVIGLELDSL
jgi:hypothetical protein